MKPVKFKEANVILAENQEEYEELHVRHTKEVITQQMDSCWELSDEEIEIVKKTKRIFASQFTFGNPFQPCLLSVELTEPFENEKPLLKYYKPYDNETENR